MTLPAGVVLLLGLCSSMPIGENLPPEPAPGERPVASADCGISALYALSRISGHPLGLDEVRADLPATRSGNFSMKELSDAARRRGLPLRGVLLDRKSPGVIDRPMLAYLNRGDHGHYLVVRPIGHTGGLVQLIDSVNPPEVLDKSTLLASDSWSGLALIPEEVPRGTLGIRLVAGSAAVVLVARRLVRWRRSRSIRPPARTGLASAGSVG